MIKKCFCDLETSGLDPKKNGIIELAMIFEVEHLIKEFTLKMNLFPKDEIKEEALKINKTSREEIFKQMTPKKAYEKIIQELSKYVDKYNKKDKFFFIGYNAPFDMNFLREFFLKNGDNYFGSFFFYPPLDVMSLSAFYLMEERSQMKNFKLMTVASTLEFDVKREKLHGALYDIQITKQIFSKIMEGIA